MAIDINKPVSGFPTTQQEMTEWQQKFEFDPNTNKWYQKTAEPTAPVSGIVQVGPLPQEPQFPNLQPTSGQEDINKIKEQINQALEQVKGFQGIIGRAETAGFGAETGRELPQYIIEGREPTPEEKAATEAPGAIKEPPPEAVESVNKALKDRIAKLEELAFKTPETTWEETYQRAFKEAGLADIKKRVDDFDAKIAQRRDELVQAEGEITENPWLTERGRVGRIKTLYDLAQKDINNLISQRNALSSEYQGGIERAERVAAQTQAEAEAGRKLSAQELEFRMGQLEAEQAIPGVPKTFTGPEGTFAWEWNDERNAWEAKLISEAVPKEPTEIEMGKYGLTEKEETKFWSEINRGINELQQGETWGNVWNRIKQQFPDVPNEAIDNALGTSWREPGAFEKFKREGGEPELSKWEKEAIIWQWLDTEEAKVLTDEEKASQIRQFGFNPEDFGVF